MVKARPSRKPTYEDIYANLDDEKAMPSWGRATAPAMKRANSKRLSAAKKISEPAKETETPKKANNAVASSAANAPTRTPTPAPEESMRRLRAAKGEVRVSGAPDKIEEPVTAAMLRDPRRE